ncbi:Serine carboxypeptidase-like 7 [Raphanus sativus]|nr:Serine carboxypeptidase-like 7 [Raphanus sativus]
MAKDYVSSVPKLLLLLLLLLILYIGVGEEEEVKLFYYFIKSERNPEEDPLLLWLSGGPGCSSISGLLFENGPLTMKVEVYNGTVPSLVSTTYSWTKISSILYLDQPFGTGFSYSSRTQLAKKPSDSGEVKRIHEFLHKWLGKHQEFFSNPFYVGGDSYSGKVVPALVQEISKDNAGNYLCCKPPLNLKGYVLGNPITDSEVDFNHRIPYAHGMALISDELYMSMKSTCRGEYETVDPSNMECLKIVEEYHKCIDRLYLPFILTPSCEESEDPSPDCYTYRHWLTTYWANDESVRRALQITKESEEKWVRCNWEIPYTEDIKSSVPGDHDMIVPFLGTQAWIRSLGYPLIDDWRPWMIGDQIAGYTRTYANKMTFATIKGGGHTPEYKPEESYIMFQRYFFYFVLAVVLFFRSFAGVFSLISLWF